MQCKGGLHWFHWECGNAAHSRIGNARVSRNAVRRGFLNVWKKTLWMYECIHCYIVNVKLKTLWMYECIGVCIGNAWGSALWMHGGLHRISFWSQFRFIRCSTKSIRLELLSCDDDMRTELHLINAKRLEFSWILNFNFSLKNSFKYNLKLNFKYNVKFNFNFNFSVLGGLLSLDKNSYYKWSQPKGCRATRSSKLLRLLNEPKCLSLIIF